MFDLQKATVRSSALSSHLKQVNVYEAKKLPKNLSQSFLSVPKDKIIFSQRQNLTDIS